MTGKKRNAHKRIRQTYMQHRRLGQSSGTRKISSIPSSKFLHGLDVVRHGFLKHRPQIKAQTKNEGDGSGA